MWCSSFVLFVIFVAGADAQVDVKPAVVPSQKSTRGVPKAPAANVPAVSSSTMAPSTPVKGCIFLKFSCHKSLSLTNFLFNVTF